MASFKQALTRVNTARTALEKAVALLDVAEDSPSRENVRAQTEIVKVIGRLESVADSLRHEIARTDSIIERGRS